MVFTFIKMLKIATFKRFLNGNFNDHPHFNGIDFNIYWRNKKLTTCLIKLRLYTEIIIWIKFEFKVGRRWRFIGFITKSKYWARVERDFDTIKLKYEKQRPDGMGSYQHLILIEFKIKDHDFIQAKGLHRGAELSLLHSLIHS